MKTLEEKTQDFIETAADIMVGWIDISPIAKALAQAYLDGVADGAKQGESIEAAYQRGRDDMRAEILATLTGASRFLDPKVKATVEGVTHTVEPETKPDKPLFTIGGDVHGGGSSSDVEPPAPPTEPGMKAVPLPDGFFGVVDGGKVLVGDLNSLADAQKWIDEKDAPAPIEEASTREIGLPPTVFSMMQVILHDKPGLTAREVYAEILSLWPSQRDRFKKFDNFNANVSVGITDKRLTRDGEGRLKLTVKGEAYVPPPLTKRKPDPLARVEVTPEPKRDTPKFLPPPMTLPPVLEAAKHKFEHKGRTVMLTLPELRVAEAMVRAFQKNPGAHLDYNFIGLRGRGTGDSRARLSDRDWCSTLYTALHPKLASVGLDMQHHAPYGYQLQEIAA